MSVTSGLSTGRSGRCNVFAGLKDIKTLRRKWTLIVDLGFSPLHIWIQICLVTQTCKELSSLKKVRSIAEVRLAGLVLLIRDVPRLDIGRGEGCAFWVFSWFSSVPKDTWRIIPYVRKRPLSCTSFPVNQS
jgi:hypothetical protein